MSYNFTKLTEVETLTKVPSNATVIAEVDGSLKRLPGSGLGGGKTLILKSNLNADDGEYTSDCIPNMEFAQALSLMKNAELAGCTMVGILNSEVMMIEPAVIYQGITEEYNWLVIKPVSKSPIHWSAEEGFGYNEPGHAPSYPS